MMDLHVVLLAGEERKSRTNDPAKVLHQLCGTSVIRLSVEGALSLKPKSVVVVVGSDADKVRRELNGFPVCVALQRSQLGSGHAARTALRRMDDAGGRLLILQAETPFLDIGILRKLMSRHRRTHSELSILTGDSSPAPYPSRVLRDATGRITGVVEMQHATSEQLRITEYPTGVYCARHELLRKYLPRLKKDPTHGRYLLSDILSLVSRDGGKITHVRSELKEQALKTDTAQDLAASAGALRFEKLKRLMAAGVTVMDPNTVYVDWDCRVGRGTRLYPQVILEGTTQIGSDCVIRSFSRISNCRLLDGVTILESTVLTDSQVGRSTRVGPSAHIRAGSVIGDSVRIGNYVEIKKTRFGNQSKAAHLSYLGDAIIGRHVNIGAGTITCNYDGVKKSQTIIEDGVFIGSNSQLIAPVRIGTGAYVAAGSTITDDVQPHALAIARGRQAVKPGWALNRRKKVESELGKA